MLSIRERQAGDATILDLDGNIIMGGGSAKFREEARRLIDEGRKKIILNFARVKYLDSSGVGELVASQLAINRRGGRLKLLNLSQKVEEVLTLSSLLTFFDVYEDESKAIEEDGGETLAEEAAT